MTFAVCGILGHFSKTLLLFFIPQIVNFLYSVPQIFGLFGLVCPRHRLPKSVDEQERVATACQSVAPTHVYLASPCLFVRCHVALTHSHSCLRLLIISSLPCVSRYNPRTDRLEAVPSHHNLLNLWLMIVGPQHERTLCRQLLVLQAVCSLVAFFIRYQVAAYFYEHTSTVTLKV